MKEGWVYKQLGEIATIRRGLTYKKEDEVEKSNKIVLRSNNVDLETHQLIFDELKYLKDDFDIPEEKKLKKGDLLMCMSNGSKIHLGKVALIEQNTHFAFGGFMSAIEHNKSVLDKFFYYALISPNFKQHIKELQDGANINNLKIRDIESFSIPVPPLPDQQRIVSYLDAEFAKIEALKANAEKQLQAAKDLFQAALKEMLTPKEGWVEKKLGDLCSICGEYGLNESATNYNGVRYLRITDITDDGELNNDKVSAQNKGKKNQEELEVGDILFARTGATVGKTLVYRKEFGKCVFAGYLIRYRTNPNIILPQYLFYYTHSTKYYDWVRNNQAAAAQPNISAQKYNCLIIAFPKDTAEQQRIADRLDALSANVKALQSNFTETITLCNDLKQALLKKVFE